MRRMQIGYERHQFSYIDRRGLAQYLRRVRICINRKRKEGKEWTLIRPA